MKLKDKTILITGASSGIGRAMALRAAKDGATVIISARRVEKLEEVAAEIRTLGGNPIVIQCDVTKDEEIKNLFLEATKDGRVIDVVYNNAGLGHIAKIYDLTKEQIREIIDVNITGMIMVAKYATEVFTRQKSGHLMFVSSMAGLIVLPEWSVYVASKWAITSFADCIRMELNPFGIQVTTVHPGAVKTEFFDPAKADIDISKLGDAITSEDVANASYDAMLTNKHRVLVPASVGAYAGLFKFFPGLIEGLMEKMVSKVEYHEKKAEDEPEFDK